MNYKYYNIKGSTADELRQQMNLRLVAQPPKRTAEGDSVYVLLERSPFALCDIGAPISVAVTKPLRTQQSIPAHSLAHRKHTSSGHLFYSPIECTIPHFGFHPISHHRREKAVT